MTSELKKAMYIGLLLLCF